MSTSPRDRESRADARRRARMAARGDLPEDELQDDVPAPSERSGGFLSRLFPPAPALPNKPPPLAGFDPTGPLRPIRERAFLLRRNLMAWVPAGLVSGIGLIALIPFGPDDIVSLLGSLVRFGALIAAGWFGWQRPALYGTAAAILGYLLFAGLLIGTAASGGSAGVFGEAGFASRLAVEGIFQAGLGFLGGWYGGYLRRRQSQLSGDRARQTRRR
jgi:hypothetical protein